MGPRAIWVLLPALALTSACTHGGPAAEPTASRPTGPSPAASNGPPTTVPSPGASTSPSPTTVSPLETIVLRPDDIGPGVVLQEMPGGRGLSQPTLDLCGAAFRSESLRTDRIQVLYTDPGGRVFLSNEVVSYQPGGAKQAYGELRSLVDHCPTPYPVSGGTASRVRFGPHDDRLQDRQFVASALFSSTGGQGRVWSAAVYQFVGDDFSGVYAYGPSRGLALRIALRIGVIAGYRLAATIVSA
jgi:hypothetical protein